MPLSIWQGLEDCLAVIVARRPAAVLDAGIGFGLWGHLLRQYLDVWSGRIQRSQWTTRIDGIEIDPDRVQSHSRHLYSHVYVGDIREEVPRRARDTQYDIILFGDVIEHLPKSEGLALVRTAGMLARDLVVLRIPLGDGWRVEGREPPDHHRSRWYREDFSAFAATVREYEFWGNPYALVAIDAMGQRRDAFIDHVERALVRVEQRLATLTTVAPLESSPGDMP
jgi:hypothetical protein